MLKNFACAVALTASLCGCHVLAAPAVVALGEAVGIASGVESIAKDVLEIDTSWHALFPPAAPSPAALR